MLAAATFGILVSGPVVIGFIPIMVVGALIFFLGIDLMREALVDTWGKVHRLEYLTIIIIVVTMGAWDFVIGILVGILLACVSFVLQTSQVSAIRGKLYGGVANSTVRRHPIQHRFLQDAGQQIHVMKLAGYLFFGTIVGVEKQIRALLHESFQDQPIRFLVLDLYNVDGVDFSAAEAFTRINRILNAKYVQLVICGLKLDGEVGRSLRNVGLFDESDGVQFFISLNSALEYCENELLKAFYHQRDAEVETESSPAFMSKIPVMFISALSLTSGQKSRSQSEAGRQFPASPCIILHGDTIYIRSRQPHSANRTLRRLIGGRTTGSHYSSSCKLSQPCRTRLKTSGIPPCLSSRGTITLLERCSTIGAIIPRASTCSKAASSKPSTIYRKENTRS